MDSQHASATPDAITIVLADDHAVVRTGIRMLLSSHPGLRVVGEAAEATAALEVTARTHPAVLVMDLNMPGPVSAFDAIVSVRGDAHGPAVVVLTMVDDPALARRALQAGATAYVLKEEADADLIGAVCGAAAGHAYLTPRIGALLAASRPPPAPPELTPRETEVLRLIALGHTNSEIGRQLGLSVRTVESHRAHIQHKLRRSTRAELVRYALDRALLGA